ncbi:hypothetical protein ABIC84_001008 [Mucilaginibacter sp. 3215]
MTTASEVIQKLQLEGSTIDLNLKANRLKSW